MVSLGYKDEGRTMQQLQDIAHPGDHFYRQRSPHLKHPQTYGRLVSTLRSVMSKYPPGSNENHLLDVGAGDGAFVEPVLASGWSVTGAEMSSSSIERLRATYGFNPQFHAVLDKDGSLLALKGQRFRIVLYASVVHHIPDYISSIDWTISNYLEPGGSLVTFQDPLWYPRLSRTARWFSRIAYLTWRLTQGNYLRGISTTLRRVRKAYDEQNVSDMAEYHVIRSGVNEEDLVRFLSERFESVSLETYWSTQSDLWQRLGDCLGIKNTFAIIARGLKSQNLPG